MKLELIQACIRAFIQFAGGYLVARGAIDNQQIVDILGGALALSGLIWSLTHKTQQEATKVKDVEAAVNTALLNQPTTPPTPPTPGPTP